MLCSRATSWLRGISFRYYYWAAGFQHSYGCRNHFVKHVPALKTWGMHRTPPFLRPRLFLSLSLSRLWYWYMI